MAAKRGPLAALSVTKRGVVVLLVVSAGVLGAGFGVLPGLLGGSDPADLGRGTDRGDAASDRDRSGTDHAHSDRDEAGRVERRRRWLSRRDDDRRRNGRDDPRNDRRLRRRGPRRRQRPPRPAFDRPERPRSRRAGRGERDGRVAVGRCVVVGRDIAAGRRAAERRRDALVSRFPVCARVEANWLSRSRPRYPSRSLRLNAVVNPPNAARIAGGP
ncbi:hypothetical protein M0R88_13000 [Halorussus gelatinilyticus]|uniref:Uncharacterized protein n=1 Tax=Halorussus gelatinilyticus TaxID=2937524 RepID=A0A8U0IEV6_9EURY|nr:hypothetical protein [Halorussus gelatinilyticus]UPV99437.1 hypothetical protein M0R88_13000 [Halorussus gelatinilyticus]